MEFIDYKYKPSNDVIVYFEVEPSKNVNFNEALNALAAESSIGTWTEINIPKRVEEMRARVFYKKGSLVKVAYPVELFELNNMSQILSSVAGNIFGMKVVKKLRLLDIEFPRKLLKSYKGPKYGIRGVRKLLKVKSRPLLGSIIKPKIGLHSNEHAKVAYEAWLGGVDVIKDDENLSNQKFNLFEDRVIKTLEMRDKAESETGEKKVYMPNITAETKTMEKRAQFVKDHGGRYLMIDVITTGFSALQTIRNDEFNLVLHAHRAMHGAITRSKDFGISMKTLAKIYRLIGVDQLHIGTIVGKMEGDKKEVLSIKDAITKKLNNIKRTFPVASGGLCPIHVPKIIKYFGNDVIIQAGGGIHGHPDGTFYGAKAMRQAIEATLNKISLSNYAKTHKELMKALKYWS